jgi:hypothetical protein
MPILAAGRGASNTNEQNAVSAQWRPGANRSPCLAGRDWQSAFQQVDERCDTRVVSARVGNRQDEIDPFPEVLGEGLTFDLSGAELRLHVNQDPLDLDVGSSLRTRQDYVRCARITVCHRHL